MDTLHLAQAGDVGAAQAFIDRNYPVVYRLALSILEEPGEAAGAARETGAALLENLPAYPGPAAHSAWLYRITLQICNQRLQRRRWLRRLPPSLRKRLARPAPADAPRAAPAVHPLLAAAAQLDEGLRLPLVLRYAHELLPQEIAEVLGGREASIQARLRQARARLRDPAAPNLAEAGPEDGLSHAQAEKLIEAAADFQMLDADAARLKRHLKQCERCRASALRLADWENELRAAYQARWSDEERQAAPAAGTAAAVLSQRRGQTARRHAFNLGGGLLVMVMMVAVVVLLPALRPSSVLPPPVAAQPAQSSTAPAAGDRGRPTGLPPTRQFSDAARVPRPSSRGDLLAGVYPGQIAYVAFDELSDHLFTIKPGTRGAQKLTAGFTENSFPAWSPDGSRLAFLAMDENRGQNGVFVMNGDGSNRRLVSQAAPPPSARAPQNDTDQTIQYPLYGPPHWSANADYLLSGVWVNSVDHYLELLPLNGGPLRSVPVAGLNPWYVTWSPDGSAVAYVADNGRELWLWEPDLPLRSRQNPRRLYGEGSWDEIFGLSWSPDSGRIAVVAGQRDQDEVQVDLRIMRKFGAEGDTIPLSTGILTRTPARSSFLAWSPDGRYIGLSAVFTNADLVYGRVLLVPVGGKGMGRVLASMDREISGLAWSADGRWLAFSAGSEVWAGSLAAYEKEEQPLVRLARSAGDEISWQPK